MKQTFNSETIDAMIRHIEKLEGEVGRIKYQSSISGMWYENLNAAGDISAISLNETIYQQRKS